MCTQASPAFDAEHPYRLTEADDTSLQRVRGTLSVLADLSGLAPRGAASVIDPQALHATLWLLHDQVNDVITHYMEH